MDALSQVLAALRMEASILSHFVLGAPWGLHCPRHPGVPFYAVIEGAGWLLPQGGNAVRMTAGDFLVLPHSDAHVIASSPGARVEPLLDALKSHDVPIWMPGDDSTTSRFQYGGRGPTTRILAGAFYFGTGENPLTRELDVEELAREARDAAIVDPPEFWQLGNTPFERESRYRRLLDEGLDERLTHPLLRALRAGTACGSAAFLHGLSEQVSRPLIPRPRGRPRKSAPERR